MLWVDLGSKLPEVLSDYPANLARDSIAGALHQLGVSLAVVTPEQVLRAVEVGQKMVLFSATTPEWPRVVAIAAQVRAVSPRSILAVGGHHVSALPEAIGTALFDFVVVGEGEQSIIDIISKASGKRARSPDSAKPLVLRAERLRCLESLPWPLRNTSESLGRRIRGLMFPPVSEQTGAAALLFSRGCNGQCSFCASHLVWGSKLITRSPWSASLEVKHVLDGMGCNALVFVDQALGEDVGWTRELCSRLRGFHIERRSGWYCMAKATIDRSLLPEMAAAGCTKIGFGVETADPEMRTRLKRTDGFDLDDLNGLFHTCNEVGIFAKAYFMIGFPWETPEYLLRATRRFLEGLRANEIKISFFTPFPGTSDWKEYSNQLLTTNWEDFDTVRMPVVRNPSIGVAQYHRICHELFRAFYSSATYVEVTRQMLARFPHYIESYREFATHLKASEMISGGEPWLEWVGYGKQSPRPVLVRTGD